MWIQAWACHGTHEEVRGQYQVLIPPFCLVRDRVSCYALLQMSGQLALNLLVSTSHLTIRVLGLQTCFRVQFYVSSRDLNPGPHTCTLPTEASSQGPCDYGWSHIIRMLEKGYRRTRNFPNMLQNYFRVREN